jgi:hypothetical protein
VAVMEQQHHAIAAAHDEAVHRLGDWCRLAATGKDSQRCSTISYGS